ncbi:hypothetical protein DL546_008918 [Coniochaeta pulveracea]|uniref:Uncharacterized protein n=1 Tax=Coniochaeta pulveracea TaxID=177199 RepID=A0A420YGR5_9PEZI|nr:hypothetical protein DL546_008918 [Coniochaeta pulveracea]
MESVQQTKSTAGRNEKWEPYRICTAQLTPTTHALPEHYSIEISINSAANQFGYNGFIGRPDEVHKVTDVPAHIETIPVQLPDRLLFRKHNELLVINLMKQYLQASLDHQLTKLGKVSAVDICSIMIIGDSGTVGDAVAELKSYHRRHIADPELADEHTADVRELVFDVMSVRSEWIVTTPVE